MQNIRCQHGHFYDPTKHSSCPHCGINIDLPMQPTTPKQPEAYDSNKTVPNLAVNGQNVPNVAGIPNMPPRPMANGGDEGKTVGMFRKKLGIDPVVGWLVCIGGPDRGKDFRLRSERNFIGRGEHMDVRIAGDDTVSRDNHAIVSYNPKKQLFRVFPGEGRGIVYLNEEEIITAEELKPRDIIEIGQTKLMFVPFCGEQFQWDTE